MINQLIIQRFCIIFTIKYVKNFNQENTSIQSKKQERRGREEFDLTYLKEDGYTQDP